MRIYFTNIIMVFVIVIAQVPGIYGSKQTESGGVARGRGLFTTAINPWPPVLYIPPDWSFVVNPQRACARVTAVCLCVCVCVCVSVFSILPSRAFSRPTRGTSGYSAENAAKLKSVFSKTA